MSEQELDRQPAEESVPMSEDAVAEETAQDAGTPVEDALDEVAAGNVSVQDARGRGVEVVRTAMPFYTRG